ncbi:MAG TPA: methyltransferase [Rickettsiales bacterium]|nr:methyltransferase [Rickettsiales bacterium]
MRIEIVGINTEGDGFGFLNNKKVFISKTYTGDVVDFNIQRETKDYIFGKLLSIVKPSKDRVESKCPYFDKCGGCCFLGLSEDKYYEYKKNILKNLGFDLSDFIKVGLNSRRRSVFKVKNNKLGFFEKDTNNLVEIDNCILLERSINNIISKLKDLIKKIPVSEISVTNYENGLDVLFTLNKELDLNQNKILTDFAKNEGVISVSYKMDNSSPFLFLQKEKPTLTFDNGIKIELKSNIFLQATREGQKAITEIVVDTLKNCKNVLDLYCGIGTYTFPLSSFTKVHAIEGSQDMIDILNQNIKINKLSNKISTECKNLVQSPLLHWELNKFDGIVINPPRNGAKSQCQNIVKSNIKKVIMVSCNPQTFKIDSGILLEGGYDLLNVIAIDQFFENQHLETVGIFEKK